MFNIIDKIYLKNFSSTSKFKHKDFEKLKTNYDRLKYVWNYENQLLNNEYNSFINQKLKELENYELKELNKALNFREEGNNYYKKKQFHDALNKYNQSLRYSPQNNNENKESIKNISLTYANRSAIFHALKAYKECLKDIEDAFKYNYPLNLIHKLIERKVDCLIKLHEEQNAINYLKEVLDNNSLKSNFPKESLQGFEKKLKDLEDKLKNSNDLNAENENLDDLDMSSTFKEKTARENDSYLISDNNSLNIDFSNEYGNHIRATKDIHVGEILINEQPYASILNNECLATNCYDCMKRLNAHEMNITFCKYCTHVSYCSDTCLNSSWLAHHQYECKYFKLFTTKFAFSPMEVLASRIVLKAKYEYLKSIKNNLINFEIEDSYDNEQLETELDSKLNLNGSKSRQSYKVDTNQTYKSDDYMNIFHLITHSNLRTSSDLVRRCMVASLLAKLLLKTSYFKINNEIEQISENSDDFYYIGGLILRHLQSISCNAHEINELQFNTNALANSTVLGIGHGIYATLSLFNHSCDPHVVRNFNGTSCVVRAIKKIRENEEVYDNYGQLYAVNPVEDRIYRLKDQYFFNCKCEPCVKKWPLYDNINNNIKDLRFKCDKCQRPVDEIQEKPLDCCLLFLDRLKTVKNALEKNKKNCQKALKSLLEDKLNYTKLNEHVETFSKYLELIDSFIANKPFQDYNDCQEAIKQCFNLKCNKHTFTKLD